VNHKKFLIIRQDRIGDVVLSTPLPREIKRKYPESFVAVLVTEYTRDIYLNNSFVDEIIIFPPKNKKMSWREYFDHIRYLKKKKFDYAFMLLPDERINYMLFLAGIRYRIGVGHKFYQFITNTKNVHRKKYIFLRHEADYCLDMLRKIGIEPVSSEPEIHLSDEEKRRIKEIRNDLSPDGKLIIGINSTSGNSAPNMPAEEYRLLADNLSADNNYSVAITDYNPPELMDNLRNVNYICKGKLLRESIINIAALDVLISASTGPMHIASALKIPTVSLFCPLTACSPKLWGPLGNTSRIILPQENYCSNKCPGDPKICTFAGEDGINSTIVLNELQKLISSVSFS
jgi:ADP-heptose:LPS heptosyltransferase